jgi:hypothetical protein
MTQNAGVAARARWADQISLGVLASSVPRDVIDDVVVARGRQAKRSDGKLPPHVMVYFAMAMALFAEGDYEEVAARLAGGLGSSWGCWDARWGAPTSGRITRTRERLGLHRLGLHRLAFPPARLKLLPSRRLNPAGSRPITEDSLIGRHRIWLNSMGPLRRADNTEFEKTLITPYSYRHSYAQRHADAGVPIDVLRELMDHTSMDATKRYFRVGETRRRQAVDMVTAMSSIGTATASGETPPRCWTASTPGMRSVRSLFHPGPAVNRPT